MYIGMNLRIWHFLRSWAVTVHTWTGLDIWFQGCSAKAAGLVPKSRNVRRSLSKRFQCRSWTWKSSSGLWSALASYDCMRARCGWQLCMPAREAAMLTRRDSRLFSRLSFVGTSELVVGRYRVVVTAADLCYSSVQFAPKEACGTLFQKGHGICRSHMVLWGAPLRHVNGWSSEPTLCKSRVNP